MASHGRRAVRHAARRPQARSDARRRLSARRATGSSAPIPPPPSPSRSVATSAGSRTTATTRRSRFERAWCPIRRRPPSTCRDPARGRRCRSSASAGCASRSTGRRAASRSSGSTSTPAASSSRFATRRAGGETYGGGRYLWDSAKGADLGSDGDELNLDFNYAYHPSCVYDPIWSCPLAPQENWLPVPIAAGERLPESKRR